jgi:hypothetical protein
MVSQRCGNVASILELDEHLAQAYKVFHHAPSVRWDRLLALSTRSSHLTIRTYDQYQQNGPPLIISSKRPHHGLCLTKYSIFILG